MEYRQLAGRDVSVIGMGTWKMRERTHMQEALSVGLDAGINHIDTAELYNGSEEAIAPILVTHPETFIVSKVMPKNADRKGVVRHCEASLERLGIEQLDCYLLHWVGDIPIEDTMAGMGDVLDAGLARSIGVSNHNVAEMEAAQSALGRKLACNQVIWHPRERRVENEVLPWCQRNGVAVVGYSGFGNGQLIQDDTWTTLAAIGEPYGRTAAQVVLDCLTREEGTFQIPKTENPAHMRENAHFARVPETYDAFDEAFPVEEGDLWRF